MSLTHYLIFLESLLLTKLKAANHTTLSPPETVHIAINSSPYFNLQYSSINQRLSKAIKTYLLKLNFDSFVQKFYFLVIHLFRNFHCK